MMVLSPLLFELSIGPVFAGDAARAAATAGALVEDSPPLDFGPPAQPLPLDALVARARQAEPRLHVESVVYRGYGHARAVVDVRGHIEGQTFGGGVVRVAAATGQVEKVETPDGESAVGKLARWIHGLHTVEYGGSAARWLLLTLALGGCVTLLTGNWVWLERRSAVRQSLADALLARLTAGVGVGCFVGLGALLLSSRLLPFEWTGRIAAEELAMATAFGVTLLHALSTRDTAAVWWRGLLVAGALLIAVPFAATRHSARGLFGSADALSTVLAVDAALLAAGLTLVASALLARRLWRSRQSTRPPRSNRAPVPGSDAPNVSALPAGGEP
jgi:uncharacterized iron-regulated membrane protein